MEEWLTEDVSIIFAPEEEMPPTSPSESTAASVASSTLPADQQPSSFVNRTTRSSDSNWYDIQYAPALYISNT